ncbi:MAG: ABC transporter substrate-binding protein [Candidatus Moranbacteria bacterium]|nr:ABC transporter substrate-binding protein [Candidatus Moranbacteria bacterium]
MCGISAIISKAGDRENILKQSLSKIIHRGSSNFEYRIFDDAAMGTNRLPIVGRSSGQQPVANEDETVFAVLNGEIFNYKEIRTSLIGKGHVFRGESDTEVLVHLYEEYGESMVDHLDSEMYAFVVFDTKTKDFYAARDRFGVKPLFYAIDARDGSYHFASELKQLVQFDFVQEVFDFPAGHFMKNGDLKRYYEIQTSDEVVVKQDAVRMLTDLVVDAVRKRVDTDLPVAVLLSGGVDSSLVMEIANRLHPDVTGYILGRPGSPDYEAAMRLCADYKYKFKVVYPDVDYAEEIEQILYHLELYEAQVIRQSFSLDILSRAIVRDGYRIALVGDASDEIFGGYNEFVRLASGDINKGCELITKSLARSHNVRLDRLSMKHTLEVRAPFFDTKVVNYAMTIGGSLKVNRDEEHNVTTKYILRSVAAKFLPDYIANRYKVPFSNGAGMNVGFNFRTQDGDVAKEVLASSFGELTIPDEEKKRIGFVTHEEEVYYAMYKNFSYDKLVDHQKRIVTKETLSQIDTDKGTTRIVAAEFDRMPLYFPVYLAEKLGLFSKRNLDVSFMSTGGDDLTYNSLFSGSAQIGISDPVFSFSNAFATKGKIFGSLVNHVPVGAVSINPSIAIASKDDFKKYRVGSYQEFSTVNTLARTYLPDVEIKPFSHKDIVNALKRRDIDIAFVSLDFAYVLEGVGGKILLSLTDEFGPYLFTGLTVSDNLDPSFAPAIDMFKAAVKEGMVFLGNFPEESRILFESLFPDVSDAESFLFSMKQYWHKKLDDIGDGEIDHAEAAWRAVHPSLLDATHPSFVAQTKAGKVIAALAKRNVSREIPYREDAMAALIRKSLDVDMPLSLMSFWGASDKEGLTESDHVLLRRVQEIQNALKEQGVSSTMTFVLSDEHGALNGYAREKYETYLGRIDEEMKKMGFDTVRLSNLWKEAGLTMEKVVAYADAIDQEKWSALRVSPFLEKSAAKRRHEDALVAARRYYAARKLENTTIEKRFVQSVHVSFSDDKLQEVFPELPTLYIWPYQRGKVDALPWFDYK